MADKRDRDWEHPWLRIERVFRAILTERWSAEQWRRIRPEIPKVLALQRWMRRTGWFN